MLNDEAEKQRQVDHDTLIRVESKLDSLTTAVQQSNVVLSAQLSKNTDDLATVKLDVDRLKNGLSLTRWFVAAIGGILSLLAVLYEAFFKR